MVDIKTTPNIDQNGLAVKAIRQMAELREKFDNGQITITEFNDGIMAADEKLSNRLTQLFNQQSDLIIFKPESGPYYEDSTTDKITQQHRKNSDAPDGFFNRNFDRYDFSQNILNTIKSNNPDFTDINMNKAIDIIVSSKDTSQQQQPNELQLSMAYTTMHWDLKNINDEQIDRLQKALKLLPDEDYKNLISYSKRIYHMDENNPIPPEILVRTNSLSRQLFEGISQETKKFIAFETMQNIQEDEKISGLGA